MEEGKWGVHVQYWKKGYHAGSQRKQDCKLDNDERFHTSAAALMRLQELSHEYDFIVARTTNEETKESFYL